jgi:nucleotide-binding universal stress UspA family protein
MNEILVATDGSEGAFRAIDYAVRMAKAMEKRLVIANVSNAVSSVLFERFTPEQSAWLRERESALASETLRAAAEHARAKGVVHVILDSRIGDTVEGILAIAEERDVELIVVGKRGAGPIEGLLIGSVSAKLASLSPRPLLVVP